MADSPVIVRAPLDGVQKGMPMKGGIAKMAAAAAAGALVLTSCSGGDATTWANDFCADIAPEVEKMKAEAKKLQGAPTKEAISGLIDTTIGAFDNMINGLQDAGEPPVDGGQEVVDKVTASMEKAKQALEAAKPKVDAAATPQEAGMALQEAGKDVQSMGDPTKDLKANEELNKAFDEAENCKNLKLN